MTDRKECEEVVGHPRARRDFHPDNDQQSGRKTERYINTWRNDLMWRQRKRDKGEKRKRKTWVDLF